MTRKIAVILGSLRNNSNSERLARAIARREEASITATLG